MILEILKYLTPDSELLSLAWISKQIHELSLLSYLSRYGITETDIASNSFPPLSTTGAFHALRLARFITGVEELHLRFDENAQLEEDFRALSDFVRRFPSIKWIDLEFPHGLVRWCDMEGALFTLISAYRSRLSVIVSPLTLSVIRPHKPAFYAARRLYSGIRAMASDTYVREGPSIDEEQFRQEMDIFPLMRAGGVIPSISIHGFDPPNPLGTLIVLRASDIFALRFPSNLRPSISSPEMTAIFDHLQLPLLCSLEATLYTISPPSLLAFLCHHPTLQRLTLRGPPDHAKSPKSKSKSNTRAHRAALPPDALPQLQHVCGSAHLVAWVLASPHPFPQLTASTLELYDGASMRDDYRSALRGIARRPAVRTLALHIDGWSPWSTQEFDGATVPERDLPNVVDLRLTFTSPSGTRFTSHSGMRRNFTLLVEWLRLFLGVREVSLLSHVLMAELSGLLGREFPDVKFMAYKLGKCDGSKAGNSSNFKIQPRRGHTLVEGVNVMEPANPTIVPIAQDVVQELHA
ncbi:hypothetical protein C8R44DRAFT_911404 [Mycena epipterygia]|nr:hypothetical protein C8R44DRAFT_911404 [Mycena epipterygia]